MTFQTKKLGIYGAGGFGRELAWLISELVEPPRFEQVCFIDDAETGFARGGTQPIMAFDAFHAAFPEALVAIAVGSPRVRRILADRCAAAGHAFAALVARSVMMSESVRFEEGTIICAGSSLTIDIAIERHVHINPGCRIGHDVRIGEFTTVTPGVCVSGNVHVGKDVYIGTGAVIINGTAEAPLLIGDGAVIGAGAVITADVEAGCLYVGVPAVLKKRLIYAP